MYHTYICSEYLFVCALVLVDSTNNRREYPPPPPPPPYVCRTFFQCRLTPNTADSGHGACRCCWRGGMSREGFSSTRRSPAVGPDGDAGTFGQRYTPTFGVDLVCLVFIDLLMIIMWGPYYGVCPTRHTYRVALKVGSTKKKCTEGLPRYMVARLVKSLRLYIQRTVSGPATPVRTP